MNVTGVQDVITRHDAKAKEEPLFTGPLVLIDDVTPRCGALNMALDEVLLAEITELPILRCYRWREREISFGCFGRAAEVERAYPGVRRVRRWTGGGVVEHGADFTFSLLVPKSLPLARLAAADSYRCIHAALGEALADLGIGDVASAPGEDRAPSATQKEPPFLKPCFSHPVEHDLLSGGEKIAGGAQRRTRQGLMHQGSVQSRVGRGAFGGGLRAGLSRGLAASLAASVVPRPITADEVARAEAIGGAKVRDTRLGRAFLARPASRQRRNGSTRRTLVRGVTT